jgi:hypothetical protein
MRVMSMISSDMNKRTALVLVNAFLTGTASRESVWQWAQKAIESQEWEQLTPDVRDAIHALWLLHDDAGSWVPNEEELRRIMNKLR